MKQHRGLGILTVAMAVLPVVGVAGMIAMRDIPATNSFVLYRVALAAALLIAGIFLIVAPPKPARIVALAAWGFLVIDAAWGFLLLWPGEGPWFGWGLNLAYLIIGVAVLIFIVAAMRRSAIANGSGVAV